MSQRGFAIGVYGKSLADNGDLDTAALEHLRTVEHAIAPRRILHVAAQERRFELRLQFLHALLTVRELPVRGHRLDAEQVLRGDHVGAALLERGVRSLPRIAAVKQQRLSGPLAADRFESALPSGRVRPCAHTSPRAPEKSAAVSAYAAAVSGATPNACRNALPVRCGATPALLPTPILTDGSRK